MACAAARDSVARRLMSKIPPAAAVFLVFVLACLVLWLLYLV